MYKKGQSGNPKGRPKRGMTFKDILERMTEGERISVGRKKPLKKEAIAAKVIELALKGEPWAVKWVADRMEGLPVQQIIQTGESELVVKRITVDNEDDEDEGDGD